MSIMTFLVKIKRPTVIKQRLWKTQQQEYARCVNWCVEQLQAGKKLTSTTRHSDGTIDRHSKHLPQYETSRSDDPYLGFLPTPIVHRPTGLSMRRKCSHD